MKDRERFVDQLLDSALARERAAEPRPGLEARLLERVRATAGKEITAAKTRKLWIAAAATAAVFMALAVIRVANRAHSPAVESSQAANVIPSTSPEHKLTANSGTTPKVVGAAPVLEPTRSAHRENKPSPRAKELSRQVEAHHWPSQFPTPAPLTAEEKALVQYVRETPPKVLAEPILKAELTIQPVEIKPLETPPLEMKPLALGTGHQEMQ